MAASQVPREIPNGVTTMTLDEAKSVMAYVAMSDHAVTATSDPTFSKFYEARRIIGDHTKGPTFWPHIKKFNEAAARILLEVAKWEERR